MKQTLSSLSGDTIKAIVLVCLAVGVVGMSYGSLAVAYGFPLWVPLLLSVSVLAGASEFMFIGIVASGGSPLAAAAAGLLVNARHIPFGVTVRELVGRRALSFIGCHIMNDESVVFGLSQPTPAQRKAAYWLCGAGVALIWPLGTLTGAAVGKLLPAPETIGLDAVFPAILLALVLSALLGQGKMQLIAALAAAQYAYFARTAHGAASAERGKDYVEAVLSTPLPAWRVVLKHIFPNCLPPLIVVATVQVANAIALEATLSFLGVGLPVTEPSLGMLISNGFQYMLSGRYWISIYPGVALIALIVAINLVGDRIRDQVNPRLKR